MLLWPLWPARAPSRPDEVVAVVFEDKIIWRNLLFLVDVLGGRVDGFGKQVRDFVRQGKALLIAADV